MRHGRLASIGLEHGHNKPARQCPLSLRRLSTARPPSFRKPVRNPQRGPDGSGISITLNGK